MTCCCCRGLTSAVCYKLFASDSSNSQPLLAAFWLGSTHSFCLPQTADQGLPSIYCNRCLAGAIWPIDKALLMVSQQLLQQECKEAQNLYWGLCTNSGDVPCGLQHRLEQVALAHQGPWPKEHYWARMPLFRSEAARSAWCPSLRLGTVVSSSVGSMLWLWHSRARWRSCEKMWAYTPSQKMNRRSI